MPLHLLFSLAVALKTPLVHSARTLDDNAPLHLATFQNKVLLVVNTASS